MPWDRLPPCRAVLAVDARNFSAHTSKVMQELNPEIQHLLTMALDDIGLAASWEAREFGQHTGDGYVAGLQQEVLPGLVGPFPTALQRRLAERNAEHRGRTPLQLRVSIHAGPLPDSGLGVPMVHTHRLLDDAALRELLARANPEITFAAFVVSQRVYEDVFESDCNIGDVHRGHYVRYIAKVKSFEQPAWLHVPGLDWSLADPALFGGPADSEATQKADKSATRAMPAVTFNSQGDHTYQAMRQRNNHRFGGAQ